MRPQKTYSKGRIRPVELGCWSRSEKSFYLVILLSMVFLMAPIVQARPQSQYWIPTFGASWPSRLIYVWIPPTPTVAHDLVVKAITIWDQAQSWFKATYFPDGKTYTFVVGNKRSRVFVEFTDYWTVSNYCSSSPLGVDGCTHIRWDDSNNITRAVVYLATGLLTYQGSKYDPLFLVLHEFGHALGLTDYPSALSCSFQDLLCLYYPNEYPSTLDLYGLHQLAGGNRETDVYLPSTVPYAYYLSAIFPKSTSMPITQESEPQSVSRFTLAVTVTIGWAVLLCLNFRRRREN